MHTAGVTLSFCNLLVIVSGIATKLYDFTPAQIGAVLNEHNYLRSLEPATNIQELIWDDHLASIAKDWAQRCAAEHRPLWQRQRLSNYPVIGENIWWSNERYLRTDMGSVIRDFHSEKKYYDYYTNSCQQRQQCGHYIQVVWAHSCAVGCAAAYCPYIQHGRGIRTGHMVVCNYGPGGNVIGLRPYHYGKPCSSCPFTCKNGICPSKCKAFLTQTHQQLVTYATTSPPNQWKSTIPNSPWNAKPRQKPLAKPPVLAKPKDDDRPSRVQKVPSDIALFKTMTESDLKKLSRKSQMNQQLNDRYKNESECESWARNGQCYKNPALMTLVCRKECNAHVKRVPNSTVPQQANNITQSKSSSKNDDCVDRNAYCQSWANAKHCTINPIYMVKWCPASCRIPRCA